MSWGEPLRPRSDPSSALGSGSGHVLRLGSQARLTGSALGSQARLRALGSRLGLGSWLGLVSWSRRGRGSGLRCGLGPWAQARVPGSVRRPGPAPLEGGGRRRAVLVRGGERLLDQLPLPDAHACSLGTAPRFGCCPVPPTGTASAARPRRRCAALHARPAAGRPVRRPSRRREMVEEQRKHRSGRRWGDEPATPHSAAPFSASLT